MSCHGKAQELPSWRVKSAPSGRLGYLQPKPEWRPLISPGHFWHGMERAPATAPVWGWERNGSLAQKSLGLRPLATHRVPVAGSGRKDLGGVRGMFCPPVPHFCFFWSEWKLSPPFLPPPLLPSRLQTSGPQVLSWEPPFFPIVPCMMTDQKCPFLRVRVPAQSPSSPRVERIAPLTPRGGEGQPGLRLWVLCPKGLL